MKISYNPSYNLDKPRARLYHPMSQQKVHLSHRPTPTKKTTLQGKVFYSGPNSVWSQNKYAAKIMTLKQLRTLSTTSSKRLVHLKTLRVVSLRWFRTNWMMFQWVKSFSSLRTSNLCTLECLCQTLSTYTRQELLWQWARLVHLSSRKWLTLSLHQRPSRLFPNFNLCYLGRSYQHVLAMVENLLTQENFMRV